jgi:hypothetical protein
MRRLLLLLLLTAATVAFAQNSRGPFLLDTNKPYVYLAFDHVGQRTPLFEGESKQGVWLRFVNNCRIPVTIGSFGPGNHDPGIGVLHEVVPIPKTGSGGIPASADPRSEESGKAPEGYSSEVYSLTTVKPGESVLFSFPLEHLSPDWYVRVRFTLAVSSNKVGDQPYSFADFRWEQLPKDVRGRKR